MKKFILLVCVVAITLGVAGTSNAQAPAWEWAKKFGGASNDQSSAVVTDASGNVYMTGIVYSNSVNFDSYVVSKGMFLAKYDGTGTVLWAKNTGNSFPTSMALDTAGNIYVCSGIAAVDSMVFIGGADTIRLPATDDIALAKFDVDGNLKWANAYGSVNDLNIDYPASVTTDHSGNVYMAGFFVGDSILLGDSTLFNAYPDIQTKLFIIKADSAGTVTWVRSASSTDVQRHDFDQFLGLTSDDNGNIYATGYFSDSSITFGSHILISGNDDNFFLVKYDGNGNEKWAETSGAAAGAWGTSVAYNHHGEIYITGFFTNDSIQIASNILENTFKNLTFHFENNIFIAKYDTSGTAIWARNAGGDSVDNANTNSASYAEVALSLISDKNGNAYLSGVYNSPDMVFGNTTLINTSSSSTDFYTSTDFFIAKYDAAGNPVWAKDVATADLADWTLPGPGTDGPYFTQGLACDSSDNIYMGGFFGPLTVTFGSTTLHSAGSDDIFIAKLSSSVTGITSISDNKDIVVFPNPASNQLTIHAALPFGEVAIASIMNVLGEEITPGFALERVKENTTIDINKFPAGVYFIIIKSGSDNITRKFIKE